MDLGGLGLPPGVDFETAAPCVLRELTQVENDHVTSARTFEVVVPFRYTAPAPRPDAN